ncbi:MULTISPECIES: MurR/RpiR family transcriptional regulator [unclassified Brenneria]|uniref:MurR/RpiR family transcriptional regulator n=1 Tax=unclassified Brenneria TaxID=2634434 RepID=UPI0029C1B9A0|nr:MULTISPECIES: MurR/RpiR family transcriptional regulator [unclassified Brenneria]MDX5627753.1 MurR/RpiR family transcriptional regulator [Brenneria sp. L3-3Z]MDX5695156.1 MurR/RpiR family transcriptional regulator [Brenneria sp. L4-2C]MEE3660380.1 MurR/RpiR family transcriptional regulator [Brenneria sp. g21c3]
MNFSALVDERFSKLTPAQQLIARYIERNKERVAFMTAKQLADAINVSDAAIVRFARALGFRGYTHLREDLGEALIERTGAGGVLHRAQLPTDDEELQKQVFDNAHTLINQTLELNTDGVILRVAERIVAARKVWVTAHGNTYPMAAYLAMHLNHILGKSDVFNIGCGDVADRIQQVNEHDVFIGIGYERYIPYTIDMMHLARERGAHVVAVTDRITSPLARESNEVIYILRSSSPLVWWSKMSTMTVVDWLISQVVMCDEDAVKKRLEQSDDAWKLLGHWKKPTPGKY